MKTKLFLTAIILFGMSLSANLFAQNNINALIEKCKTMNNVEVVVVKHQNKQHEKKSDKVGEAPKKRNDKASEASKENKRGQKSGDKKVVSEKRPLSHSTASKRSSRESISINIVNNKALADEFLAAFKKDSETADSTTETETNGVLTKLMYVFNGEYYNYSQDREGNVNISIFKIRNNDKK